MSRPLFLPLSTHLYRLDLDAYWAGRPPRGGDLDDQADEAPARLAASPVPGRAAWARWLLAMRSWTSSPTA